MPLLNPRERTDRRHKWYQSLAISLCVVGVAGVFTTLTDLKVSAAETRRDIQSLQIQVAGAYRADIAKRDVEDVNRTVTGIQGRVDGLDRRVRQLERVWSAPSKPIARSQ